MYSHITSYCVLFYVSGTKRAVKKAHTAIFYDFIIERGLKRAEESTVDEQRKVQPVNS